MKDEMKEYTCRIDVRTSIVNGVLDALYGSGSSRSGILTRMLGSSWRSAVKNGYSACLQLGFVGIWLATIFTNLNLSQRQLVPNRFC